MTDGQLPTSADRRKTLLELETRLMNGELAGSLLQTAEPDWLGASPLLLLAHGDMRYREGDLAAAREMFAQAAKQFASQLFGRMMLSALAQLAKVQLNMGSPEEAKTILLFIQEELRRDADLADGHMLHALALGAHLLPQAESAIDCYEAALEHFSGENRRDSWSIACLDMLYTQYFSMDKDHWRRILYRFECLADQRPDGGAAIQLLHVMDHLYQGRWDKAWKRISEQQPLLHSTHFLIRLWTSGIRLKAAILCGAANGTADFAKEPRFEADRLIIWQAEQGAFNLEARFERESLRYLELLMDGEGGRSEEEKAESKRRLEALELMGISPARYESAAELGALAARARAQAQAQYKASSNERAHQSLVPATVSRNGSTWRVQFFHGLRFSSQDVELNNLRWGRKKTLELLLFLLTKPHYSAPKEWIAEALYEGEDSKKAANQLYVAVHQLKRMLREHFAAEHGAAMSAGTVFLQDHLFDYVDVEKYMTLARVGNQLWTVDRELAVELYAKAVYMYGEMLPELHYIDWLDRFRTKLADYQATMLRRLGQHSLSQGNLEEAAAYYEQWTSANALHEEAYQALLQVLVRMGRHAEARSVYARFEKLCLEELDAPPLAETRNIVVRQDASMTAIRDKR